VITGGPGCGKSTLALHFADAGLQLGESVVMLVSGRADDLKSHAAYLGIDLETPLRTRKLTLFRYRSEFTRRAAQAPSPEHVVTNLGRIISPHRPARIIIDTFSPFVIGAQPVAPVVAALAALLERFDVTSMLTFPEDLASSYDRSLVPIVENAAAVIRLAHDDGQMRRAELLSIRYPAPASPAVSFLIRRGVGIVAEETVRAEHWPLSVQ
jgi:KaiC/GvpD/RAD55 family RecA-like ATPase